MNVYTELEKMILDFNQQVLALALRNRDLEIENATLKSLVETYKAKAELVIELSEDLVSDRELRLVK